MPNPLLPLEARTYPQQQAPEAYVPFRVVASTNKKGAKTGDIYVFSEIGYFGVNAETIRRELAAISDAEEITIHVNSPGGSVFDGFAIYNQIRSLKGKKKSKNYGLAASMASIILLAADEVEFGDGAMMMIHNPSIETRGQAKEIRKDLELLEQIRQELLNIYAMRTNRDNETGRAEISSWMDAEKWFGSKEALALGLSNGSFKLPDAKAIASQFSPSGTPTAVTAHTPVIMIKLLQALGLAPEATEDQALAKLAEIKAAADPAVIQKAIDEAKASAKIEATVEATVTQHGLTEKQAKMYGKLLAEDAEQAGEYLSAIAAPDSLTGATNHSSAAIKITAGLPARLAGKTYDELQKNHASDLEALRLNHPAAFAELYKSHYGVNPPSNQ